MALCADHLQCLLHAIVRFDVDLRVRDFALFVDHEVAADDARVFLAHHLLLAPHPVSFGDGVIFVDQ